MFWVKMIFYQYLNPFEKKFLKKIGANKNFLNLCPFFAGI